MRLKDKVAIITGGSRGIGYATADKFLKEGATVILTASSQGSADKAVAQLKEKYPDATVAGISPNLSNLESVRNAFREAASKYGCIDILVKPSQIRCTGRWWLHWIGAGRKPERAGDGCHHCPASKTAYESL